MISVVIQGGAMRSIYCLGAVRALVELGLGGRVRTVHTSSAGCVSAAVLANQIAHPSKSDVATVGGKLLDRLASRRFINYYRFSRIVDVDYLVSVMSDVVPLSSKILSDIGLTFEVGVTDAATGHAKYLDLADGTLDVDLSHALRATMAIPVFYPVNVEIRGRRYLDGGISDPLPVLRAFPHRPEAIVAITSVPDSMLAVPTEGHEAMALRYIPGIPAAARHLMLTRNPLADAVEDVLALKTLFGVPIVKVGPSNASLIGSRLEIDKRKLVALEELGYQDGLRALQELGQESQASILSP